MEFRYWVEYFLEIFILAYILSTISFLVGQYLNEKLKNITKNYLSIANLTILIIVGIKNTLFLYQNFQINSGYRHNIYYNITIFILICIVVILSLKKYREKIKTTYLIIFLIVLVENTDRAIIIMTSFHRDYIPSSWNYIDLEPFYKKKGFHILIGTFLYFFVCYFLANSFNKKKVK